MKKLLQQLVHGSEGGGAGSLSREQAEEAFEGMMAGTAEAAQMAALLTALAMREPTEDELVGAATVMRRHAVAIDAPDDAIDVCGTGGTSSVFLNVSTAAGIVAAACGVPVVKHGNRSVTSRSGSSDVLAALGVNIETTVEQEEECLRRAKICFAFAPRHHPAMRHVSAVRQALGFPTIFNLVGPLTNPAGVRRQLVGVGTPALAAKILRVLVRLGGAGARRMMAVAGRDPVHGAMCEISVTGETEVVMFDGEIGEEAGHTIFPADLGLERQATSEGLVIGSAKESAAKILGVLRGEPGAAREIVLANAGAALWVGGVVEDVSAGVLRAREAVDSGAGLKTLEALAAASHGR